MVSSEAGRGKRAKEDPARETGPTGSGGESLRGETEDQEGMGLQVRLKMAHLEETAFQREQTSEVEDSGFDRSLTAREERARRRVPDLWKELKALKAKAQERCRGGTNPAGEKGGLRAGPSKASKR